MSKSVWIFKFLLWSKTYCFKIIHIVYKKLSKLSLKLIGNTNSTSNWTFNYNIPRLEKYQTFDDNILKFKLLITELK